MAIAPLDALYETSACMALPVPVLQPATDRLVDALPSLSLESLTALGGQRGKLLAQERQSGLAQIVLEGYYLSNPHTHAEAGCFPLSDVYLRGTLKTQSVALRDRLLAPFVEKVKGGYLDLSTGESYASAYRLHPAVKSRITALLEQPFPVVDLRTGEAIAPDAYLSRWLGTPWGIGGNTILPPALKLPSVEMLDSLLATASLEVAPWLRRMKAWAISFRGYVPTPYSMAANGRIGPPRGSGSYHVVSMPAEVRKLLWPTLLDLDLSSSHWACFAALAQAAGVSTPMIRASILDKPTRNEHLQRLASLLCVEVPTAKALLLATLTNAGELTPWNEDLQGLPLLSPEDALDTLKADAWYKALQQEVKAAAAVVLHRFAPVTGKGRTAADRAFTNCLGVECREGKKSKRLAHLLSGVEQACMAHLSQYLMMQGASPKALIYDGVLCEGFSEDAQGTLEGLSRYIVTATLMHLGFPVDIGVTAKQLGPNTGTRNSGKETLTDEESSQEAAESVSEGNGSAAVEGETGSSGDDFYPGCTWYDRNGNPYTPEHDGDF